MRFDLLTLTIHEMIIPGANSRASKSTLRYNSRCKRTELVTAVRRTADTILWRGDDDASTVPLPLLVLLFSCCSLRGCIESMPPLDILWTVPLTGSISEAIEFT